MELTGKLKEKVDQAKTREEKKKIIEEAGIALTDDELDKVAGGMKIVVIRCPDLSAPDLPQAVNIGDSPFSP